MGWLREILKQAERDVEAWPDGMKRGRVMHFDDLASELIEDYEIRGYTVEKTASGGFRVYKTAERE